MSDFDPSSDYEASPVSARRFIESDRVEGTTVYDARGHRVGVVKRLIIEKVSGQVAFVVIAFESFFGIGGHNHARAWNKLHYDPDLEGYRTEVTEELLSAAPDFPVEPVKTHRMILGFRLTTASPHPGALSRTALCQMWLVTTWPE